MELLYVLIEIIAKSLVVFVGLLLMTAYNTLFERKVLGHIQVRYGPNRVGPFGLSRFDMVPTGSVLSVFCSPSRMELRHSLRRICFQPGLIRWSS
jgi:hypothetical protein